MSKYKITKVKDEYEDLDYYYSIEYKFKNNIDKEYFKDFYINGEKIEPNKEYEIEFYNKSEICKEYNLDSSNPYLLNIIYNKVVLPTFNNLVNENSKLLEYAEINLYKYPDDYNSSQFVETVKKFPNLNIDDSKVKDDGKKEKLFLKSSVEPVEKDNLIGTINYNYYFDKSTSQLIKEVVTTEQEIIPYKAFATIPFEDKKKVIEEIIKYEDYDDYGEGSMYWYYKEKLNKNNNILSEKACEELWDDYCSFSVNEEDQKFLIELMRKYNFLDEKMCYWTLSDRN